LPVLLRGKGAGRRPAVRKAKAPARRRRYEKRQRRYELNACAGEPFLCQGKAAPFEAQGKQAV
jgi:hypothetical protein